MSRIIGLLICGVLEMAWALCFLFRTWYSHEVSCWLESMCWLVTTCMLRMAERYTVIVVCDNPEMVRCVMNNRRVDSHARVGCIGLQSRTLGSSAGQMSGCLLWLGRYHCDSICKALSEGTWCPVWPCETWCRGEVVVMELAMMLPIG